MSMSGFDVPSVGDNKPLSEKQEQYLEIDKVGKRLVQLNKGDK